MPGQAIARRHLAALAAMAVCGLWLCACAPAASRAPLPYTADDGDAGAAGASNAGGAAGSAGAASDGGAAGSAGTASDGGAAGSAGTVSDGGAAGETSDAGAGGTAGAGGAAHAGGEAGSGGTSAGGSGGSAGVGGGGNDVTVVDLIDDFESGDGSIPETDGRIGAWYAYNDETPGATQSPAPGETFIPESEGRSGSGVAAHTTGGEFKTWGAGIGVDFYNDGLVRGSYDASAYQGITFWARGSVPIDLKFASTTTTPVDQGGSCVAVKCDDHHGSTISLSGSWAQYSFSFAELKQQGWGAPAEFDEKEVISLHFEVEQDTAFDFWLDDVGFY